MFQAESGGRHPGPLLPLSNSRFAAAPRRHSKESGAGCRRGDDSIHRHQPDPVRGEPQLGSPGLGPAHSQAGGEEEFCCWRGQSEGNLQNYCWRGGGAASREQDEIIGPKVSCEAADLADEEQPAAACRLRLPRSSSCPTPAEWGEAQLCQ